MDQDNKHENDSRSNRLFRSNNAQVMTRFVAATVNYAIGQGVTMEEISAATGIKRTQLIDDESRLPDNVVPQIWRLLDSKQSGPSLGLHMVSASSPSILGPCEHLVRYADTLRTAVNGIVEFGTVVADRVEISFIDTESSFGIQMWHPLDEVDKGNAAEVGVSMLSRLIEECLGNNFLLGVDFAHAPLGDVESYQKFFDVPVKFNQNRNTLIYRQEALDEPMLQADKHLFRYVQANLELIQDRWLLPGKRSLLSKIYEAVKINAELGKFSTEELAITLRISLRKLQREVQSHGLTLSNLLEDAREVTAKELLKDKSLSIEEVALSLDYADGRAFRRAFSRWTGETPSAYRKIN